MQTWRGLVQVYLEELMAAGRTPSTMKCALLWNGHFAEFCRQRCELEDIGQVTAEHAALFEQRLQGEPAQHGRPYMPHSVQNAVLAVRQFFRWAVDRGYLPADPFAGFVVHRAPVCEPDLTCSQAEALLEAPDPDTCLGLRDRAILATLYRLALRLQECRGLDLDDVDLAQRILGVRSPGQVRYHAMDEGVALALERYLERGRPGLHRTAAERALFIGEWGRRLHALAITRIVREHGQRLGLKSSPSLLRHASACHRRDAGATRAELQALLDLQRASSARRYVGPEREGKA